MTLWGPLLLLALTFGAPAVRAAESERQGRRTIGVALSGGSSFGLSHIGVLKYFEEHRIPIDFIAGTSMGGLVGGFYATGATAEELERFARTVPWEKALAAGLSFEGLTSRRKEDRREFTNEIEFGLKGGFRLPPSLLSGHEIGLLISRSAAPYEDLATFDGLPTPFRCVAVDLIRKEQVVFSDGSLWYALRSTMSLPGVFAPVNYRNKLLIDGGALNNLPVDVTRSMGADVVIAVMLESPPMDRAELETLFGVARRSLDVIVTGNEQRNLRQANMVVAPDLRGFNQADYGRWEELIARGYEAAARQHRLLARFALPEQEWARFVEAREAKRRREPRSIEFVNVVGIPATRAVPLAADLYSLVESPFARPALEDRLDLIAGLGPYSRARYGFVRQRGAEGLIVDVNRKTYGPPFLNLGILLEAIDVNELRANIGGRATFHDFLSPSSELRTDFSIGLHSFLRGEYYRRLPYSRWFVAPRAFIEQDRSDLFERRSRIATLKFREAAAGVDMGYTFQRTMEFRAGYLYSDQKLRPSTGVPGFSDIDSAFHILRTRFVYDGQDSPVLPRKGSRLLVTLDYRKAANGVNSYPVAAGLFQHATELHPRTTLVTTLRAASTFSADPVAPPFELGGAFNLSALGRGQLRGKHFYYGSANALWRFTGNPNSALYKLHASLAYEAGHMLDEINGQGRLHSGAIGFLYPTPVGAVYLGGAFGESGFRKLFFRFGRVF